MATVGSLNSGLTVGANQSIRRNAGDTAFEAFAAAANATVNAYTASQTLVANSINLFTPAANLTATLPTAIGVAGQSVTVKKTDAGVFTITMAATSSQTINGAAASAVILTGQTSLTFISDNANWHSI